MLLKLLLGIILILAITELLVPSIFGLNQGVLTGLIDRARLEVTYSKQIETQKRERKERNLPPEGEIVRMQKDKTYCYFNDDCRTDPESLPSCDSIPHNKYFSCSGGLCGVLSDTSCTGKVYFACENNRCVKKQIAQ